VQVPQYLAGHQVEFMLGLLMLSGTLGYGVAVGSYNQQMLFNYIAEDRLMPDLETMSDAVGAAFAELLAEARKVNAPPVTEPLKLEPKGSKGVKGSKGAKGSKSSKKKKSSAKPAA
jgi:hypothetical protein